MLNAETETDDSNASTAGKQNGGSYVRRIRRRTMSFDSCPNEY